MFAKHTKILFQGDSITDGGRGRTEDLNHILGHGYAYLIAAKLGCEMPELDLKFINRGCSGNRLVDLYARWQEDALNLTPDFISILIGINDVMSAIKNNFEGFSEKYERDYRSVIAESMATLPHVSFILCEPFALPVAGLAANWKKIKPEINKSAKIVKNLADEFGFFHVQLQDTFNHACKFQKAEYWLWDGVHPTAAGHGLIAREWLKALK